MKINRLTHSIFILLFTFALAFGQTPPPETAAPQNNQTTADENFELNITSERITETNFERSTNVELNNRNGLRVEVGVGVRAERIDVLLRGIFGSVRFRASLESIKNRLEQTPQNSTVPPR